MSYLKKKEYEIIPKDSYQIIRNCPKCGIKTRFRNTDNFRVNANGNQVDVWMIYQCEKCKHTYNLGIYERVKPSDIEASIYEKFQRNDAELALEYGNCKQIFIKNKAEIALEKISYETLLIKEETCEEESCIIIKNPYELKIRIDKIVAEILQINRNQVKKMQKEGIIDFKQNYAGKIAIIYFKEEI